MHRNDLKRWIAFPICILILPWLISCTILPRSGPSKHDVYSSSYGKISIIPISLKVADITNRQTNCPWLISKRMDYDSLGIGDKLEFNIWENASEGLYTGNKKGVAHLGPILISGAGTISLPYVGKVKAEGFTIDQLQQHLRLILKNKIMNPQVVVNKIEAISKQITIQGAVSKPGTFEIMPGRYDLLSLLAEAGGSTCPAELTQIMLERQGRQFHTTLLNIFQKPHFNIALHPKDNLVISEINRSFTALGATGIQHLIKFPKDELSLIEAMGLARGLSDELANPSSVFLLRTEENRLISDLTGQDCSEVCEGRSPVIYELKLRQMPSIYAAQQFKIRDGDLILATNAPYTNVKKILSSLSPAVALGRTSF
ncbi:MAG: polysaccharide biosynthesis/export family protein [Legionella sp.]|nr:polysaccharide biosynthesis/export family protein [Legionella sp.]